NLLVVAASTAATSVHTAIAGSCDIIQFRDIRRHGCVALRFCDTVTDQFRDGLQFRGTRPAAALLLSGRHGSHPDRPPSHFRDDSPSDFVPATISRVPIALASPITPAPERPCAGLQFFQSFAKRSNYNWHVLPACAPRGAGAQNPEDAVDSSRSSESSHARPDQGAADRICPFPRPSDRLDSRLPSIRKAAS